MYETEKLKSHYIIMLLMIRHIRTAGINRNKLYRLLIKFNEHENC